ncbi:MAG: acetylornithine deacetylase [Acidobacteriota bacterium]|nr:acetylornithine deacetylase [Acidobacteriota bacterium]
MGNTPSVQRLLERLVAFDTTSHESTREIVEFICNLVDRPGIRITRHPDSSGRKENLVISAGPPVDSGTRPGLLLCGHLDVVPATEPDWTSPPFELIDGGDRWVGRGTADMKGFLALSLHRLVALDSDKLVHPLILLFTRDEELGSLGAAELIRDADPGDTWPTAAVVGEPTSLRAIRLHKGHLRLDLAFKGRAAHSGYPHRGRNAIEVAGRAVRALAGLRTKLEQERGPNSRFFSETPFVAFNLGIIEGGSAVNVIPAHCRLRMGLRPLPGDVAADLTARVEECLMNALEPGEWSLSVDNDSPPLETAEDAPIHQSLRGLLNQRESFGVSFASDAGYLSALGIEAVLYGPGSIEVAHKANEFVPKAEMAKAAVVLEQLVEEYCCNPEAA